MIAIGTAYGTAGDTDYAQLELRCITAHLVSEDVVKGAFYEDFSLDILLGGVVQWCWDYEREWRQKIAGGDGLVYCLSYPTYKRVWSLTLLYYKIRSILRLKSQVVQLKPPAHCSGFVLHSRGRHWHRVSKLRRN